jgi:Fe-S oxidoreductase
MLTLVEKLIFVVALGASIYAGYRVADRIRRIIARGRGADQFRLADVPQRLGEALFKTVSLTPVFRARPLPSLFHAFVAWGFMYYLLVNLGDVLQGFIPGFVFLGEGPIGGTYRLLGDVLSVGVLVGVSFLLVRRFVARPPALSVAANALVHPRARAGIRRDSAIVGGFILLHVGARFVGASFDAAAAGGDAWQPFASALGGLWAGWSLDALAVARHVTWWLALGSILAFVPYFLRSKHIHLFFAPINFFLKPRRTSIAALDALNFEDESITQYGAARLEDLGWPQLVDAWACIMCNRCQEVCPAHNTGKVLSPAALEINKRYQINGEGAALAAGQPSSQTLLEFAISAEAVWACTACSACIEVCPVGNEPMRDILDIRRDLVLMQSEFPGQLQTAYQGMERTGNPWNVPPDRRLAWAEGLDVPTVDAHPDFDVLWWVGCAPATDANAQKTARAFATILKAGGVNFAVLGPRERCTGDAARRSGNEYLFFQLAQENVATLNEVKPKRIVTTCPHCLHTLKNEYGAFGGHYEVVHHTQLINELVAAGKLKLNSAQLAGVAYHDPCYLGRANGVYDAPRTALAQAGAQVVELGRRRNNSFCCGAGGAQMWKEEEHGTERISHARFKEIQASGAQSVAVGCPFCMVMLGDAAKDAHSELRVRDVAEIVAEALS